MSVVVPTSLLFWSLTVVAIIHIVEEFVFPGGFKAWYRAYKPQIASSLTNRFLVIINGILLLACVYIGLVGSTPPGIAAWLTISALLFSNAIFHLIGAWQMRCYSPGMVSGLLFYMPLFVYGLVHFLGGRQVSLGTALLAVAIGGSYQWVSSANHRWRSRRA